jgi:hypothetical protein
VGIALPSGQVLTHLTPLNPHWGRVSLQERFVNTACFHTLQALRWYGKNQQKETPSCEEEVGIELEMPAQL